MVPERSGPGRLATGGRIDRGRMLRFRFDRQEMMGHPGDTLASALLANGVRIVTRSFKYHRPRGIMGAGSEEPAALVTLAGAQSQGNVVPTTLPLTDGMEVRTIHGWPSVRFDLGAVAGIAARLIPAGFYYKTFMWPSWHLFEPAIRKAAGLARAPEAIPEGRFEVRNAHCDLLVVGAGPAGLMAALVAARAGARVILADEGLEAGGSLLSVSSRINDAPGLDWVAQSVAELSAFSNVSHLQQATVWGWREHGLVLIRERAPDHPGLIERGWRVRARHVICATGAIERLLVFPGNDRPGVMLASAAQAFVNRWAVRPGQRAVIFTNNDSAYAVARDLAAAGIEVAAVIDSRAAVSVSDLPVLAGHQVMRSFGWRGLTGIEVAPISGGAARRIGCDLLAVSGGWNPSVHLHAQSRGSLRWDHGIAAFRPDLQAQSSASAGAADGRFGLSTALQTGAQAATGLLGLTLPELPMAEDDPYSIEPLWAVRAPRGGKAFVDPMNDVTLADLELAVREGFGAVEHAKRYTTAGMALDQGKTGNVNVIGVLAELQGTAPDGIGTTTFRAPYTPVSFGSIAGGKTGPALLPFRHTPLTDWHKAEGAVMYEAGARWRRPGYYTRPGESFQQTVDREARAARRGVAIYDGAPLGLYAIEGPDALRLIEHACTARYSTLPTGMGRYGLMLTEDGLILDDGVVFRLAGDRFLMSCSTGNADAVGLHLERILQIDRPAWRARVVKLTHQWMNATICGPNARAVLARLTDLDLSTESFPFMALREGHVAGHRARVARVSFTGEQSYEINTRPRDLPGLWSALLEAGAAEGIVAIGSEANHVLRVEKGFISLGHEADGTVDPFDLGMGWAMAVKKGDFIGLRSVKLRHTSGRPRRELVGLLPEDPSAQLPEGAPITPSGRREASEGLVTACVRSVVLDRWVALALLTNGRARLGEQIAVRLPDRTIVALVVPPVFYDPDGLRMRG
jgi:sarcosine oxidase, subunit alpha